MRYDSYATYYDRGAHALFPHEVRDIGGLPIRLVRAQQGPHALDDPPVPELLLGLVLAGRSACRWTWGDGWNETASRKAGDFGISPADTGATFETEGHHAILIVGLTVAPLAARLEADGLRLPDSFGRLHDAYHRDTAVARCCLELWRLAKYPDTASHMQADGVLDALIARLLVLSGRSPRTKRAIAPLSRDAAARAEALIRSRLADPVTVAELAAQAGLGPGQFIRAFAARFGRTPHQFLLQSRVDDACRALRSARTPISRIAHDLGFAHQSHFTRVFSKMTGETPAAFRERQGTGRRRRSADDPTAL